MSLDSIRFPLFFLMSYLFVPSVYATTFSNTSIDKQLGANSVTGTFIDNSGATGGAVESASTKVLRIVVAVCVFVGFILVAKSLYDLYIASRDRQGGYGRSLATMVAGAALAILPIVTFVSSNSVQSLT